MNIKNAIAATSLWCALSTQAAVITWTTPATISGASDISTAGTLVGAYSLNTNSAQINGVGFTNGSANFVVLSNVTYGANFQMTGLASHYALFGAGSTNPYASLTPAAYTNLIGGGDYVGGLGTIATLTATNLTIGHQYQIEVWANDSRTNRASTNYANLYGNGGGNNVAMYYNNTGLPGGLGTWSVGTFVADATTQGFSVFGNAGSGQADTYVNAVQLRDLGAGTINTLGLWNGLAGSSGAATLDYSSLNFCTNLGSAPVGTAASLTTLLGLANACYFEDSYFASSAAVPVTSSNLTVAAGGVAIGTVTFANSAVTYTLQSSDSKGITDGSSPTTVNKLGSGTVVLDGANSYSGGTYIGSGTVQVGNADGNGTLGSGPVTNNSALVFNRSDAPTFNNAINGSSGSTLTQESSGTATLSGNNTYAGKIVITNAGTLSIQSQINGATYAGTITISTNAAGSPSTLNFNSSAALANTGVISGGGQVTATGSGTVTLSGANTFSGGMTVGNGSAVTLTTGGYLAGGAGTNTVTINGSGVLTLSNNAALANRFVTGGSSSIMNIILTSANLWLTNSLANFLGAFNVNYFNPAVNGGQLVVGSGAGISPNINSAAIWNVAAGAVIDFNGGQIDPATVNLYGLPYATAADGALRLDNSTQSGNVILHGNTSMGNGAASTTSVISGVISDVGGSYGFTYAGAAGSGLSLQSANTYHGATIINTGTLYLSGSGSIANSSGISLANGTTFDVSGVSSSPYTLGAGQSLTTAGATTINGSLTMNSASPLTIGLSTASSPVLFSSGAMTMNNCPVTVNITPSVFTMIAQPALLVNGVTDASTTSTLTINGLPNTSWTAGNAPGLQITSGSLYLNTINFPIITSYAPVTYSNLYVYVGGVGPTLSLTATGNPAPSYQWYDQTGLLAGQTGTSYTVPTPATAGAYTNYCVVQNSAGVATNFWVLNVIATNSIPAYPLTVLRDSPVAYWRLDEPTNANGFTNGNAGAPANDYIGGHDGFYTNVNLGYQPGYSPSLDPTESAAQFGVYASANSVVEGTSGISFSQPSGTIVNFSIEAWVKCTTSTGSASQTVSQGEYGADDAFELAFDTTAARKYRFLCRTGDGGVHTVTSASGPDGNWHYLVGVCDQTDQKELLYLDGILTASGTVTTTGLFSPANPAVILGAGTSTGTGYNQQYIGQMSDVAIYNYAFTSNQVTAHYIARGVAPTITLPTTTTNIDLGAPVVMTASETGTPPLTNSWLDSNANVVVSTTPTLSATPTGNDKYVLRVTNAYNPAASATLTVTTYSGAPSFASPGFNMTPTSATAYVGYPVTFSVLAYGSYPMTYQWYKGANAILGATNSSYTASTPAGTTTYQCVATGVASPPAISQTATLVGIIPPASYYADTVLSNNPIAYWRLNEADNGTGDIGAVAYDYVGGHNAHYEATGSGVILGQPGYNAGDTDTCALFGDGTAAAPSAPTPNSYAGEIDNSANGTPNIDFVKTELGGNAEFTVEAWVKSFNGPQVSAGTQAIVAKGFGGGGEQFLLACHTDSAELYFRAANLGIVNCQTGTTIDDGNWHHLVGISDQLNATARVYVDGQLANAVYNGGGSGLVEPSGATLAAADLVSIGSYAASKTATTMANQWVGYIDEVALYTNVLSATDIAQHYTAGTNALEVPFEIVSTTFAAGTGVTLTWQSVPGVYYQVNQTASLVGTPTWTSLGVVQASSTSTSFTDPAASSSNGPGYYRVVGNVPAGGYTP